jgi:prepilin-type N-terminal cleavage/methylation domain-containing protein
VKARGFTLLETLLALMVFSLAVVALVEAVHQLGTSSLHQRREAEVQEHMRSLLLEHTRMPLPPEELETREGDVTYTVERIRLEDLRNLDGQPVQDLFEVRVTATWTEGSEQQQAEAATWVDPPLFQQAIPR